MIPFQGRLVCTEEIHSLTTPPAAVLPVRADALMNTNVLIGWKLAEKEDL